jgi:hypothetical protein
MALNCVATPAEANRPAAGGRAGSAYSSWDCAQLAREQHRQFQVYRAERRISASRQASRAGGSLRSAKASGYLRVGLVILPRSGRSAAQSVARNESQATPFSRFRSNQHALRQAMLRKGCGV